MQINQSQSSIIKTSFLLKPAGHSQSHCVLLLSCGLVDNIQIIGLNPRDVRVCIRGQAARETQGGSIWEGAIHGDHLAWPPFGVSFCFLQQWKS